MDNDPGHTAAVEAGTFVFAEGIDALARTMRIDLDAIECDIEFAHATQDVVADGVAIRAGHVGGMDVGWHGVKAGVRVLSLNQRWVATPHLEPAWKVEHCYLIEVVGDPHVNIKVGMFPTDEDLADARRDVVALVERAGHHRHSLPRPHRPLKQRVVNF